MKGLRRDRASAMGVAGFLFDRALEDCLDRLSLVRRDFDAALLAGCPIAGWPTQVPARDVRVIDPGDRMARLAGGKPADLECLPFEAETFDLVISIGLLDSADDLRLAASALHLVLRPGGLLLGAISGGDSLVRLRAAMLDADRASGAATPRLHPRIEPANLGHLLSACGFAEPVVDVDRVRIGYRAFDDLVRDLRAMGATNILRQRSRRPITRDALDRARVAFLAGNERVEEQVDIIHFAAWKPASAESSPSR